jgi:hypothetical protein
MSTHCQCDEHDGSYIRGMHERLIVARTVAAEVAAFTPCTHARVLIT